MSTTEPLAGQNIYIVPSFTLESGTELKQVPVAYKTWGQLNATRDNVMIICHAFTGSADVEDWWGPLMGRGKAFDPQRFFVFCANVLGSPYGTASPVTVNPDTQKPFGPEFPQTTIRDDVRVHKLVLDHLGASGVAVAIGGSMGGMAVLEWPLCTPQGYVRHIIPIATSARHSAWCISWGETQRQSIYSDPMYRDGYYDAQPSSGLAAARMAALLTYRSRDSFEQRFGRRHNAIAPPLLPCAADAALAAHNEGCQKSSSPNFQSTTPELRQSASSAPPIFSAQSYLRYQGAKFLGHTRCRSGRTVFPENSSSTAQATALAAVLATLPRRALVISIETDGLFTPSEQKELATHIPEAELVVIPSPDGHDGFLLEFEQINKHILRFLRTEFPEYYQQEVDGEVGVDDFKVTKTSLFGEAELDVTRW
ncbi:Alpha/Beta hydrolase protein [Pisolithus tinctorius]|nr:Alpha/Beta hydrolase protein [Pisolithus tinctorius]